MKSIIKKGSVKFKTTCVKCSTVFTYEEEDIRGWHTKKTYCPVCLSECIHHQSNQVLSNA